MNSIRHAAAASIIAALATAALLAEPPANPQSPPAQPGHGAPAAAAAPTVQLKPGEVPKIEFDTLVYDFGRSRSGVEINHDYWFHNTGNGPLEILQVKPSCGCTTTNNYDKVVQPGKSGKIPIKVSPGQGTGPITKTVMVTCNAPGDNATVTLQIKGELWQVVQASPANALFGNISAAQTKEGKLSRVLTVTNNTDKPITLKEALSTNPNFSGRLKELEAGKKWELTVQLNEVEKPGVQTGTVDIATGISDYPKLSIQCSAFLVSDVEVVPAKMILPSARNGNVQREFHVRSNAQSPVKVSDVTASNPMIKVTMQETQPGKSYRITMEVPPEYKAPAAGDQIAFKTDHPNFPSVSIPVTEASSNLPTPTASRVSGTMPGAMTPTAAKPAGK